MCQEIVDGTKTSHSKDIASEDLTVVCHHKMCSPVSYPKGDESSLLRGEKRLFLVVDVIDVAATNQQWII